MLAGSPSIAPVPRPPAPSASPLHRPRSWHPAPGKAAPAERRQSRPARLPEVAPGRAGARAERERGTTKATDRDKRKKRNTAKAPDGDKGDKRNAAETREAIEADHRTDGARAQPVSCGPGEQAFCTPLPSPPPAPPTPHRVWLSGSVNRLDAGEKRPTGGIYGDTSMSCHAMPCPPLTGKHSSLSACSLAELACVLWLRSGMCGGAINTRGPPDCSPLDLFCNGVVLDGYQRVSSPSPSDALSLS